MDKLDILVNTWLEARDNLEIRDATVQDHWQALMSGYEDHFGDAYLDVLHVMMNHMGAEMREAMHSEVRRLKALDLDTNIFELVEFLHDLMAHNIKESNYASVRCLASEIDALLVDTYDEDRLVTYNTINANYAPSE